MIGLSVRKVTSQPTCRPALPVNGAGLVVAQAAPPSLFCRAWGGFRAAGRRVSDHLDQVASRGHRRHGALPHQGRRGLAVGDLRLRIAAVGLRHGYDRRRSGRWPVRAWRRRQRGLAQQSQGSEQQARAHVEPSLRLAAAVNRADESDQVGRGRLFWELSSSTPSRFGSTAGPSSGWSAGDGKIQPSVKPLVWMNLRSWQNLGRNFGRDRSMRIWKLYCVDQRVIGLSRAGQSG